MLPQACLYRLGGAQMPPPVAADRINTFTKTLLWHWKILFPQIYPALDDFDNSFDFIIISYIQGDSTRTTKSSPSATKGASLERAACKNIPISLRYPLKNNDYACKKANGK